MTKTDLIKAISDDTEVHANVVAKVLDGLARVTSHRLSEDQETTIPGLVKLGTKERAARKIRNIRTGEPLSVAAKRVVTAKPVNALAKLIA